MNQHIETRMAGIQKMLMSGYEGGGSMPNASAGDERERFVTDFLSAVLSPMYRFSRGAITDVSGERCGQLEVIMELPFGLGLTALGGKERLYVAEAVNAVIEVKSNLYKQWGEATLTVEKVKTLRRNLSQPFPLIKALDMKNIPAKLEARKHIPCYIVGFTGHKTVNGLEKRLSNTRVLRRPDGVLVLESGVFIGLTGSAQGPEGLYMFASELIDLANEIMGIAVPNMQAYSKAAS